MKKLLIPLLVMAFALTACGNKAEEPNTASGDSSVQEKKSDKGVWSTIRDAVDKAITLECEYTDTDGAKSITYIKGKTVRVKAAPTAEQQFEGLIKDDMMWMWDPAKKEGFTIDLKANASAADDSSFKMDDEPINSSDDIINKIEEQKQNCKTSIVPDSFFDVPADIKFMDLAAMFSNWGADLASTSIEVTE